MIGQLAEVLFRVFPVFRVQRVSNVEIIYKEESYRIMGACFEVYN